MLPVDRAADLALVLRRARWAIASPEAYLLHDSVSARDRRRVPVHPASPEAVAWSLYGAVARAAWSHEVTGTPRWASTYRRWLDTRALALVAEVRGLLPEQSLFVWLQRAEHDAVLAALDAAAARLVPS